MNIRSATRSAFAPAAAVSTYVAAIACMLGVIYLSVADMLDRYRVYTDLSDMLTQLDSRLPIPRRSEDIGPVPTGAPFLEGATQAVAGAALLQRVTAALGRFGGTIQSSQVELQGARAGDGYTTLTVSCELPEPMLQSFLYDIESGTPFLFIDSLVVQSASSAGGAENAPLRLLLEVSGQWRNDS